MKKIRVFISYSHDNQEWLERVKKHILPLGNVHTDIDIFDDSQIKKGSNWHHHIISTMEKSNIILMLISSSYIASNYIRENELKYILNSRRDEQIVIPLFISPCSNSTIGEILKIQGLNSPDETLARMNYADQEEILSSLVSHLDEIISELRGVDDMEGLQYKSEQQKESRYNIAVIGKTGVGKSSLINYFFSTNLCESDAGKPVTKKGFHQYDFEISGIPITVFDSWGLEVGNSDSWIEDLNYQIKVRGLDQPVSSWFHTILYCVSASEARIENFEIDIIKELLNEKYRVVVVFTKADLSCKKDIECIKEVISKDLTLDSEYISICCKEKTLISGFSTKKFGKDALRKEIQAGFWKSIKLRLPEKSINSINTSRRNRSKCIDIEIKI